MDLAVYDDNGTHVNFVHAHSNFISKIDLSTVMLQSTMHGTREWAQNESQETRSEMAKLFSH